MNQICFSAKIIYIILLFYLFIFLNGFKYCFQISIISWKLEKGLKLCQFIHFEFEVLLVRKMQNLFFSFEVLLFPCWVNWLRNVHEYHILYCLFKIFLMLLVILGFICFCSLYINNLQKKKKLERTNQNTVMVKLCYNLYSDDFTFSFYTHFYKILFL